MEDLSLEYLRAREHDMLDYVHDDFSGFSYNTPVDKMMELNNAGMGEDSEEVALRSQHTNRMLQRRPIPCCEPH